MTIPQKYFGKNKQSLFQNILKLSFILFFGNIVGIYQLQAQTTQVQFGQNRVQYHRFDWQYYNTDNFTIYFYPGGQEIGKFVWTVAEMKLKELDKQMDFHFRSQVDILVYNDISDLAQTNIGLGQEDYNIGGTAILHDNKLFLHYDGNHRHLQRDLLKGLSALYIRQMMSGSSFGQKIQNAIFLVLPEWYKNGLAAYMGETWNTELDARLKHYLLTTKKTDFNRLVNIDAEFAGHSFWYMINAMYGKDAISNILYVTRVNHSISKGLAYAVNRSIDDLMRDWKDFYSSRYELDNKDRDSTAGLASIRLKKRNNSEIGDMKISPDGKYAAYAAFDGGFYKIFLQNLQTKKSKKIAKGGFRSDQYPFDKSYPILTWTKTGHTLAVISEKKDIIRLRQMDLDKKTTTKKNIIKFQKIHGADYTNNPNVLIVSGQNKGQTDLYLYNVSNATTTQLNNDLYDDLNPVYINWNGTDGVLFSSNRQEDKFYLENMDAILPTQTLDLFFYDLNKKGTDLARITQTPFANEKAIGNYSNQYYTFLSDENGISNQYAGTLDSIYVGKDSIEITVNEYTDSMQSIKQEVEVYKLQGKTFPLSNYSRGIQRLNVAHQNSYQYFGDNKKHKSLLYIHPKEQDTILNYKTLGALTETSFRRFHTENILTSTPSDAASKPTSTSTKKGKITPIITQENTITLDSLYTQPSRYFFESNYNNTLQPDGTYSETTLKDSVLLSKNPSDSVPSASTEEEPPPFLQNTPVPVSTVNVDQTTGRKIRILHYRAKFTSDYVVTQLDNSIMTQNYQSFKQNLGSYNFPYLGGMINFGVSDLMEDHKIIGGFRIPFDFKGFETYVKYINLKKRIDKSILYYRKSDKINFNVSDINGNILPFVYSGKTRTNFFETAFSYPFDITKSLKWSVSYRNERLDISYTDEISRQLKDVKENWLSGRLEFVQDNSKEIQFNILNGFRYKLYSEFFYNINEKKSAIFNVGFDIRHYQKIYRNIIWANRFAGASSFGQQKILYFLGGVDTWLNPKYANDIPIASNQNYGLQAPVTNLRGLPQNIRNGNNYLLWNSELRVPVFSLFAKKPLKSAFLRDFQLVGFFDAGIAYNLMNPFNAKNALSNEVVTSNKNPIVVTVNYYRNPFVFGTGGGIRTNILGYFIRLDTGFGYDGLSFNKKPIWHFSLSKDF
jgi:hypothetical protein